MIRFWTNFLVFSCASLSLPYVSVVHAAPLSTATVVRPTFSSGGGQTVLGESVHHACIGGTSANMASADGRIQNFSGALRTHVWRPDLDADADGLADESDADNDNDGLTDRDELAGDLESGRGVTDLGTADTDGDGLGDGQEVLSGTDPLDSTSQIRISDIVTTASGHVRLSWIGHPDWTYRVRSAGVLPGLGTVDTPGRMQREAGALGTARYSFDDESSDTSTRFYSVEIEEK
ncbi:MAG: hypothetical protein ACI9OU_000408 [Candidatus Promineifilaceae bacterium]